MNNNNRASSANLPFSDVKNEQMCSMTKKRCVDFQTDEVSMTELHPIRLDALEKRFEVMVEADSVEMKKLPDAMENDTAKINKEQEEAELEKFSFAAEIINDKLNILKEDYMKMDIRLDELKQKMDRTEKIAIGLLLNPVEYIP